MSELKNADCPERGSPVTGPMGCVCLGVNKGDPCAVGQNITPLTFGMNGNAEPQVLNGGLYPNECGLGPTSSPCMVVKGGLAKPENSAKIVQSAMPIFAAEHPFYSVQTAYSTE